MVHERERRQKNSAISRGYFRAGKYTYHTNRAGVEVTRYHVPRMYDMEMVHVTFLPFTLLFVIVC